MVTPQKIEPWPESGALSHARLVPLFRRHSRRLLTAMRESVLAGDQACFGACANALSDIAVSARAGGLAATCRMLSSSAREGRLPTQESLDTLERDTFLAYERLLRRTRRHALPVAEAS